MTYSVRSYSVMANYWHRHTCGCCDRQRPCRERECWTAHPSAKLCRRCLGHQDGPTCRMLRKER